MATRLAGPTTMIVERSLLCGEIICSSGHRWEDEVAVSRPERMVDEAMDGSSRDAT